MNIAIVFIYLVAAIVLFFILNYFDKAEKENNLIHAIIPIVYEILIAGLFTNSSLIDINKSLYWIIIFELVIRLYYVKNILRRDELVNTSFYLQIYGIAIVGCYLVNQYFISQVSSVFPTAEEMRVGIWLLIILFLYFVVKKHIHIQYKEQVSTVGKRKQEYIVVQYTRFKNAYHKEIKLKEKGLYAIFYAIMIYENYKRPFLFRKIDHIFYRFTGKEKKQGIMQILSQSEIDDKTSIKLAAKKLEKANADIPKKSKKIDVQGILTAYYEEEKIAVQVLEIYEKIIEFNEL